ncbi:MAG: neuraminidase-like domain-containing protein [Flavobacteriales bacterium]
MAFAPPYYGYKEFFASKEQPEIHALLEEIKKVTGLDDIYRLARGNAFTLAGVIKGEVTLADFWAALSTDATMIATLGAPANPSSPTLGEQRVIDGMLEQLYSLWPGRKRAVIEAVIRYVGEDVENTTDPYRILTVMSHTSYGGLEDDFYTLLAEYYIAMAAEYIRVTSKEYVFLGRVLNAPSTHGPVRVSCIDENAGMDPKSFGWTTTNVEGYFKFAFRVIEGLPSDTYDLKMTFSHPLLTGTDEVTLTYHDSDPTAPEEVSLSFTTPTSTSSTIAATGITVPTEVTDYLVANGLTATRLEDIRRLGGFRNLPGEGIDPEDTDLVQLDGLASLELLQGDLAKNQTLFSRGYRSLVDVGTTARKQFVDDATDLFGEFGAGRVHYQAKALHLYGVNNAAAALAPIPDHELGRARSTSATATGCDCPDCRSAVSPIAYLADLIRFAGSHLSDDGNPVDITYLEDNFHHQLGGLQLDCDQLKKPVCQNRIAAETLRHFQDPEGDNAPEGEQLAALQAAEKNYLVQAYELLLGKLGTSYNEVRSARGDALGTTGQKLALRLGIPLEDGAGSTIERLFIDLSDLDNITEGQTDGAITGLETLFGLRDTRRDPLSDPDPSLVEQWKLAGLRELWEEQDGLGPAFPGGPGAWNTIIDPDVVTIDDLREPRTDAGDLSDAFVLWNARREWIDAEFLAMDAALVLDGPSTVERRRSVFKEQRLVVAYGLETMLVEGDEEFTFTPTGGSPITYTMVDQFVANGNTYFHIAEEPDQDYFSGTLALEGLPSYVNTGVYVRSCAAMVARLEDDLTTHYGGAAIPAGWDDGQIDVIRPLLATQGAAQNESLAAMALDRASAKRLVELYDKNQAESLTIEPEGGLTEAEWIEFKNLLLMVLKRRACDGVWRTEEETEALILSPEVFMPSVIAPREGDFPISGEGPFLDPDLVGTSELPEITAATYHPMTVNDPGPVDRTVYQVIEDRREVLVSDREALLAAPDIGEMLELAFDEPGISWSTGEPATNEYLGLLNDLADPEKEEWTRFFIEQRLKLTETELRAVVVYGTKVENDEDVPAGERESVLALLQRSHKLIVRYRGEWLTEEASVAHWALRKARIPKWRGSLEQRAAWLNALARNSQAPIIDPDLIGPSELKTPETGDSAYTLWNARNAERDTWLTTLSTGHGVLNNLSQFNALLKENLGFVEPSIESLRDSAEAGVDIRPRIAQLNLTTVEFNQLMVFHDLLAGTPPIALRVEEKEVVRHILVRVKKRRQAANHRNDEAFPTSGPIITLTPDHFKSRQPGILSFPPDPPYPIRPWLASETDLAAWRRKLESRVDQERTVIDGWQEALFEVDEAMMVHLRDALVAASGDPDENPITNARHLGDRFLTDLENNCCYKTNRVAAAIETMQQLVWKTRTGDIRLHYPDLAFNGDFDQAWEWMGSYANWRAAMFVFLYPENVLHPSLRSFSSQAFKDVVDTTRNNRRFGPADACTAAHAYEAYLKDLNELEVCCGQQARTWRGADACGEPQFAMRNLTYVFAKAKGSKRLYYAVVDTNDTDAVKQTACWNAIPTPEGVDYTIRGSHRYINDELSLDHILLFVTDARDDDKSKFYMLRYALRTQLWDEQGPEEFAVSTDELKDERWAAPEFDKFDPSIRAMCVMKNLAAWQAPVVVVTISDAHGIPWSFKRAFNGALDGFEGEGHWNNWITLYADPLGGLSLTGLSFMGPILDCWNYHPEEGWDYTQVVEFFLLGEWSSEHGTCEQRTLRHRILGENDPHYQAFHAPGIPNKMARLMVNWSPESEQTALIGFGYWPELAGENHGSGAFDHPSGDFTYVAGSSRLGTSNAHFVAINPDERFASNFQVSLYQEPGTEIAPSRIVLVNTIVSEPEPGTFNWDSPILQLQPRRTNELPVKKAGSPQDQALRRTAGVSHWAMNRSVNDKLLVPIAEASYFVPMQIALQLHANGHYQEALDWFRAVYDHTLPAQERKISYLLKQEENLELDATLMANWYADPLNPHAIASVRPHTYTRYTIRAIVSCLLDYADAEFTTDNSETVPRARELYEDALDLLKYLSGGHSCAIEEALALIGEHEVPREWVLVYTEALERLEPVVGQDNYGDLLTDISEAMEAEGTWGERLAAVNLLIDDALAGNTTPTLTTALEDLTTTLSRSTSAGSAGVNIDIAYGELSRTAATAYDQTMELVTGRTTSFLSSASLSFLSDDTAALEFPSGLTREYVNPGVVEATRSYGETLPAQSFYVNDTFSAIYLSGTALAFCVVPNPVVNALVLKAEVELFKIHNCMNIAGMVRELDPFAAPTDSTTGIQVIGAAGGAINVPGQRAGLPSAYRYRFLVERARQLVGMAQQVEAAFLSTLEKLDAERYAELRAEQDVATSKANIKLQDLKVKEAEGGVKLAELQRERASLQAIGLQGMIDEGLLGPEQILMSLFNDVAHLSKMIAISDAVVRSAQLTIGAAGASVGYQMVLALASAAIGVSGAVQGAILQSDLANANEQVQLQSLLASFERRKQEWEFQLSLARKDEQIGDQQIKLANDRVRIVGQEREIAVLQNDHAKATLDFLRNKFTNAELYEWMSGVLEDVYAWFLQEATAVALLAERQLVFERNLDLPPFIRSDYWQLDPNQLGSGPGEGSTDRRGLTGSTRLLRDLTELDQAAFSTNSPKRQLSKTFSLSELAPEELIRLRTEGIASFYTTHEHFDRDYPGHYLRLIKKVSVSVIALVPPTKGVRGTLTNGGASRVYTGGVLFQEKVIKRYPDEIALSSGVNDGGVFQMQPESEFLDPFEGSGVDTLWEFRMDKAANPFDFGSIADVLITIDYTALSDRNRRTAIATRLNGEETEAALAISMKNNLPDQWFDLHNTVQSATPYAVTFNVGQRDLAPHVREATVSGISLFVVMKDEEAAFNGEMIVGLNGIGAAPVEPQQNVVTSAVFASSALHGAPVVGEWSFQLPGDFDASAHPLRQ